MGQGRPLAKGVTPWAPGACTCWGVGGCGGVGEPHHTSERPRLKGEGARELKHQFCSVVGEPAEWGGGTRSLALGESDIWGSKGTGPQGTQSEHPQPLPLSFRCLH